MLNQRRALIAFWVVVAGITVIGIGILQYLGPPEPPPLPMSAIIHGPAVPAPEPAAPAPAVSELAVPKPVVLKQPTPPAPVFSPTASVPAMSAMGTGSTLAAGLPIPAPNPALLGPAVTNPSWQVPKIGPNGLTPMHAYAATVPAGSGPHIALLVAGLGDDDAQSQEAIMTMPAAVSLGITPYGQYVGNIAALARASGHEVILEIPMQALNSATENAGNKALVMAGPITLNQPMLDWNLAQFPAYAGVTDAIGASQGAGFMNNPNAKAWLLQEVADKGLFFIDARKAGITPYAWNRTADVVIDPAGAPQNEAAQLTQLIALAKLQGNAMGILMFPSPNAIQMLQSWTQTLPAQGVTLVPVSAMVLPPTAQTATTGSP